MWFLASSYFKGYRSFAHDVKTVDLDNFKVSTFNMANNQENLSSPKGISAKGQ